VGQVGPNTAEANQAHFGAWAIVSSPLILGMNLSDQSAMEISWPIVSNKEVVAVNQQWSGHPGKLVREYYPSPGEDGPANGTFAWALPCDYTAAQTGWSVDTAAKAVKVRSLSHVQVTNRSLLVRSGGSLSVENDSTAVSAWQRRRTTRSR